MGEDYREFVNKRRRGVYDMVNLFGKDGIKYKRLMIKT